MPRPDANALARLTTNISHTPGARALIRAAALSVIYARPGQSGQMAAATRSFVTVGTNEHSLSNWLLNKHEPQDPNVYAHLLNWVRGQIISDPAVAARYREPRSSLKDTLDAIDAMPGLAPQNAPAVSPASLAVSAADADQFRTLIENSDIARVGRMFNVGPGSTDAGKDHYRPDSAGWRDFAYYLGFRYGLTDGHIVKSFFAIGAPPSGGSPFHTVYHARRMEAGLAEMRGPALHLGNTSYLFGGASLSRRTMGMKLIAIPDFRNADPIIKHGLVLSSSAEWTPVIGRFALLGIGYRRDLATQTGKPDAAMTSQAVLTNHKSLKGMPGLTEYFDKLFAEHPRIATHVARDPAAVAHRIAMLIETRPAANIGPAGVIRQALVPAPADEAPD